MRERLVAPSLLSADFGNLEDAIKLVNRSHADWIHLDIMDGVFVPNITIGFPVIKKIKPVAEKPFDVHLMIVQPERYIQEFKNVGADILTVQYEACTHLHRTIELIKQAGMKAGVALNPHTPVHSLEDIITDLDMVLIMSVNPGFGGQTFIPNTIKKIKQCRELIEQRDTETLIEIDGGVNSDNVDMLYETGVNVFVAGNAVFNADDPYQIINKLKGNA